MKIALAQINTTIGDFNNNYRKIEDYLNRALQLGADLCIFPEMITCGYPPKDFLESNSFIEENEKIVIKVVELSKKIPIIFGTFLRNTFIKNDKPLINCAIMAEDGIITAIQIKRSLYSSNTFNEQKFFLTNSENEIIHFKNKRLSLFLCDEIFENYIQDGQLKVNTIINDALKLNPDILISIAASPYEINRHEERINSIKILTKKTKLPFIFVNCVGGKDTLIFDGNSFVMDAEGNIVAKAKAFEEDLIIYDTQTNTGDLRETINGVEKNVLQALILSLRDYMKGCGFTKAVVGLSGGIDSALTATIATLAIGSENVLGVKMPSPYTSKESIEDATLLAQNLGIKTYTIDITPAYEAFINMLKNTIGELQLDTTLENIQARIRGILLMALSNKFGYLVLSTGNKSELAVGYCTLYGDLVGGFSILSDVPKTLVYRIARYINENIGKYIPERCFTKPPSAELRPGQKDQDDLPPYEILDDIIYYILEKNLSYDEIIKLNYDANIVNKVISMLLKSEYKRKQAPVGPKITSKPFGSAKSYPLAHNFKDL